MCGDGGWKYVCAALVGEGDGDATVVDGNAVVVDGCAAVVDAGTVVDGCAPLVVGYPMQWWLFEMWWLLKMWWGNAVDRST